MKGVATFLLIENTRNGRKWTTEMMDRLKRKNLKEDLNTRYIVRKDDHDKDDHNNPNCQRNECKK
jgi:hypothetical protein